MLWRPSYIAPWREMTAARTICRRHARRGPAARYEPGGRRADRHMKLVRSRSCTVAIDGHSGARGGRDVPRAELGLAVEVDHVPLVLPGLLGGVPALEDPALDE